MDGYVDAFWTDPFNELHDKWFLQVYKEDLESKKGLQQQRKKLQGETLINRLKP